MAELLFKRGTQASLNTIRDNKTATDGTFYLTTDTGRIYAGIGNEAVELNKSITVVQTIAELQTMPKEKGQFYYVVGTGTDGNNTHGGNILVVYDGTQWVQINPDTDHYLLKDSAAVGVAAGSTDNSVKITTTIKDTLNGTAGLNTATGNFTLKGGKNVDVTLGTGNVITLDVADGALYEMSTAAATVNGKDAVKVSLIENPDSDNTDAGSFSIVEGSFVTVERDNNGNILLDSKDPGIKSFTITSNDTKGVDFTIKDANDVSHKKNLNVPIKLDGVSGDEFFDITKGKDKDNNDCSLYDLPIYTSAQTDAKIAAAITESHKSYDALRYQGLLGNAAAVNNLVNASPLTVSNGDVYKISGDIDDGLSAAFKTPDGTAITKLNKGDLIIFKGTETNGVLTAPTAEVIPSGDDQLIKCTLDAANNTITIQDEMDAANKTGIKVIGGTAISVSSSKSNGILNTTITHGNVTKDTTPNSTGVSVGLDTHGSTDSETFTIVEAVEANDQGHVTKITTRQVTIADTHTDISKVQYGVAKKDDNTATVSLGVSTIDSPDSLHKDSIDVKGIGNVVAEAAGTTAAPVLQLKLVWGEF